MLILADAELGRTRGGCARSSTSSPSRTTTAAIPSPEPAGCSPGPGTAPGGCSVPGERPRAGSRAGPRRRCLAGPPAAAVPLRGGAAPPRGTAASRRPGRVNAGAGAVTRKHSLQLKRFILGAERQCRPARDPPASLLQAEQSQLAQPFLTSVTLGDLHWTLSGMSTFLL